MVAFIMTTALALMAVTVEMPTAVTHKIALHTTAKTKGKIQDTRLNQDD